jgi:hypothetical protein
MPTIKGYRTAFANSASIGLPEFAGPQSDGFIADVYATLGEQILDIPATHGEPEVEPNRLPDNVRMKSVPSV